MPKLIVLSALRASKREHTVVTRHAQFVTSCAQDDGDGTFLVDLEKLATYGSSSDRRYDGIWRRPTPPACPPAAIQPGKRGTRHHLLGLLEEDDYEDGSILLPYHPHLDSPSEVLGRHGRRLRETELLPDNGGVNFTFALVEVPAGETDGGGALPAVIEDAAVAFPKWYAGDGRDAKLPQHILFPPSNATGLANPFARLPAEHWFGDVYSEVEG